jgi:thiol-disulfide isomerase/thioredoxin
MSKISNFLTRFLLPLIFLLALTACRQPNNQTSADQPIYFSDYRDKWILINYWAEWCKPCRHEMPALNTIYKHYKDNLVVFGVSFDPISKQTIQEYVDQYHLEYPMLMSNPADYFGIDRHIPHLPATYIFSPQRKLVSVLYGGQTTSDLSTLLLTLLHKDEDVT